MSPSNSNVSITTTGGGDASSSNSKNYIEHQVSKMDTLAGIAIKYGVEVCAYSFLFFSEFGFAICLIFFNDFVKMGIG